MNVSERKLRPIYEALDLRNAKVCRLQCVLTMRDMQ